jgi:two-component system phosphate regulon response regulator OmpR
MYPEGKHILVIDSEPKRRQLSESVLAEEGFSVAAVAEGLSAIRTAAGCRVALAVGAVDLPGTLNGLATLRQMRARQPWLKALFVGDPARRPARLDADRDDFIGAPLQRRELLGCVFELLQREPLFGTDRDLAG